METINQPKRGRPRKTPHDAVLARQGEDACGEACGDRKVVRGDVEAKAGPNGWKELDATLNRLALELRPKTICRVWVDFEAPEHWSGHFCGAKVDKGPWKVLLNTGESISP